VVLEDNDEAAKGIKDHTEGRLPRLALNSVGGESALRLLKCLENGGHHVTFGAMAFEPVRWPTRQLIFQNITIGGFWMDQWYRRNSAERTTIMMDKIFDLMARGIVKAPIAATYPLAGFQEALAHAQKPRLGKVLFRP
jgi:mitochondrial enoyl-[acyl-carrier protein] reductase / trans-2-enoyl-CoA reductase